MEIVINILNKAMEGGLLSGFQVVSGSKGVSNILHLLFVDYTILLSNTDVGCLVNIMLVLLS
jgi:hypothetical protein